jgi:hypothetical protein
MEAGYLACVHSDGKKAMTEFGVYYTSGNPILFRITEDSNITDLKEKIRQITMNRRIISEVCYRSPFLNENGVVSYEEKELCLDDDVREMVKNFIKYEAFTGPIELYVKFLRSTDEILELCQTPTYDNCMQQF